MNIKSQVIDLLKVEVNVLDYEMDDEMSVGFHTKGDPEDTNDPLHKLSDNFWKGLTSLGIDKRFVYENDCEGFAGEFIIHF